MVFVIIPVFNRKALTLACLKTLFEQTYKEIQVIIVDDGSTDGSAQTIKERFPQVRIVTGSGSWWWTKSVNEGIKTILPETKPEDYVLLLNNDTTCVPEYIAELVKTSVANTRAITGSYEGGVFIDWKTFSEQKASTTPNTLPGRGVLIPVEVFKSTGLFRNRLLPQYAADYDFFIRATRKGHRLVISQNARVEHTDEHKPMPFFKKYFSRRSSGNLRSRITFALLNAPTLNLKLQSVARVMWRFFRAI